MTQRILLLLFFCFVLLTDHLWAGDDDLKKSVVLINSTAQSADYYEPWKPGTQQTLKGCGVVLPSHQILTTAHLVNRTNQIEVRQFNKTHRYLAHVVQEAYDLDLAILTVDDPSFFDGTLPVQFADLPSRGDKLLVQGGTDLSIKDETVQGMNMVYGSEGAIALPAIITAGPIEDVNNGCPVFKNGKLVGIPFDCSGKPDKTGSLIPVNLIERFLKFVASGKTYLGNPDLGFYTQDLENPALRDHYKIAPKQTGEIITTIIPGGSSDGVLQEGDVLTTLDGYPVDDEGYVMTEKTGRIPEIYLASLHNVGEKMDLGIIRNGQAMKIEMELKPISRLLDYRMDRRHPTYFIMGGLVFQPLSVNYFLSLDKIENFKPELQDLYFHGLPSKDRKQVILMSHVLPHEINKGYEKVGGVVVTKINGQNISDMEDVLKAFQNPVGHYHVIEIDDFDWYGSTLVLDADAVTQANEEILSQFKIPSDRSEDLKTAVP